MSLNEEFKGKVVLVSGSSSGIGETTVLLFAKLGAKVVVTGRDEYKVNVVADKCQQISPQNIPALKFVGDLGEDGNVDTLMNLIFETYNQLDVVVNNAGRLSDRYHFGNLDMMIQSIDKSEPIMLKAFDDLHQVNLRAVYQICLRALPLLEKSKGVIINNSSICGLKPFPDMLAYCVSKAGLDMMTRCLALDWGPKGIRVNSINPGQIQTPIFERYMKLNALQLDALWTAVTDKYPLKRPGLTDDIAKAILFLASSYSTFITGIQLKIDGGFIDSAPLAML